MLSDRPTVLYFHESSAMLLLCMVNLLRVNVLQMKGKRPETCLMNSVTFVVVVQVKQTDIYRVKEHKRVILES